MNSDEIQYRQNNSIYTENIHRLDNSVSKSTKVFILTILIVVTFVIYVLRLFTLQVVEGQQHRTHSEVISKDITTITSQRGEIFDRNAKYPMVINTDSFCR